MKIAAPAPAAALLAVNLLGAQEYKGPEITLEKVADGVYATVFAKRVDGMMNGNGTVIVNDSDVVVVDTQDTPAAARTVIAALRRITSKPVRYVVNTHFHGDHNFGNQVYREAYPGVEFISHPDTRADLIAQELPALDSYVKEGLPKEIAALDARRQNAKPEQQAQLTRAIAMDRWMLGQLGQVHPIPAGLTVSDSLVLHRGERTIAIRFLGRGNTRGDLVVYLPKERVLVTGDLLVSPMPYATDAYLDEWIRVLDVLRATPAAVIVPGHGAVQHDASYIDLVSALLTSTMSQVRTAVATGMDLEATRRVVNLDSLRRRFTGGDSSLVPVFDGNYTIPAVASAWKQASETRR